MTDPTTAPWYYRIFVGQGLDRIREVLGPNAFKLRADQTVDTLHDHGYAPDLLNPSREALPTPGVTTMIRHKDRVFLVSVDALAELIAVQEVCRDAHLQA